MPIGHPAQLTHSNLRKVTVSFSGVQVDGSSAFASLLVRFLALLLPADQLLDQLLLLSRVSWWLIWLIWVRKGWQNDLAVKQCRLKLHSFLFQSVEPGVVLFNSFVDFFHIFEVGKLIHYHMEVGIHIGQERC